MPDEENRRIERAIEAVLSHEPLTRRSFLRRAARAGVVVGGALSLPAILAACGVTLGPSSATPRPPSLAASGQPGGSLPVAASPAGALRFANRPLYIDTDEKGGSKHTTITDYEAATKSDVTYTEEIRDDASFFAKIRPALAAGRDTGYDLVVLADWMIARMAGLGYLEPIDVAARVPNFSAHAGEIYRDLPYDPRNGHSVPWQCSLTGIGYDPRLTKRQITGFSDLFDPAFKGHIGMSSDMRDTMNLALLGIGVKPHQATMDDVGKAQKKLLEQAPLAPRYYDGSYADALARGDLWITIARCADIFQLQFDNPELRFAMPVQGGLLRVDAMAIPARARHPLDAEQMMNFVYQPPVAARITEYVNHVSPVPEAQALVRQHAREAADGGDSETSDYLGAVAGSPLVFPTPAMLALAYPCRILGEAEEKQWNDLFSQVVKR